MGPDEKAGCEVELTEIRTRGEVWWTLGFEASGPAGLLRRELEAAAAVVFARALPGGLELRVDDSASYAQWLSRRQVPAETDACGGRERALRARQ
jgi:hypothetical protein